MASITQNDTMKLAAKSAIKKLNYHTTPGGAMVCAEGVNEKKGSANEFYEYCATTEFLNPLGIILSLTGDFSVADRIEKMTFNALQGGRLPDLKALSYITSENRMHTNPKQHGERKTYDAYHKAAACCALNAGRVMPYYIQHMWKKNISQTALIAALYGPNKLNTQINGINVQINERTDYPFSEEVNFDVESDGNVSFDLVFRKPHGCKNVDVEGIDKNDIQDFKDKIVISRKWEKKKTFSLKFDFDIKIKKDNNEIYFQRGALIYAMPVEYRTDTIRTHKNTDFHQFIMHRTNKQEVDYSIDKTNKFKFTKTKNDNYNYPFDKPLVSLTGSMLTNKEEIKEVTLVPLGNTVLRKVSFRFNKK